MPALARRAGGRRVHAPRHHRGPRPARSRPARRPAQADLQEGRPQARGPDRRHGAEGDGPQRRRFRRVRRHRPEGLGAGPHQPARQPIHQEPARRGERRRRGDGLGDGRGPGAEAGLADDGQAGHGAASRPASGRSRRGGPGGEPRDPNRARGTRAGPGTSRGRRRTRAAPARLGADLPAGRCPLGRRPGRDPVPSPRSGSRPRSGPRPGGPGGPGDARRDTAAAPGRHGQGPARAALRPARSLSRTGRRSAASFRIAIATAGPAPRPPSRPSRPGPPPPPLSKDALAGNVPLRTFGQLKQLWEARVEGPEPKIGSGDPPSQPPRITRAPAQEPPTHPAGSTPPPDLGPTARARDAGRTRSKSCR